MSRVRELENRGKDLGRKGGDGGNSGKSEEWSSFPWLLLAAWRVGELQVMLFCVNRKKDDSRLPSLQQYANQPLGPSLVWEAGQPVSQEPDGC